MNNAIPQPLVRWNNWINVFLLSIGLLFNQPLFVLISTLIFTFSSLFKWNPIIYIGKNLLRKPLNTYIPEDREQLRFNSTIATIMLNVALLSLFFQWSSGYYIFTGLTLAANLGAAFGYCIGCIIRYRWLVFRRTGKLL